jgi:hypothetical protein
MAQFIIPDDVLRIFAACEAAYADASRRGYLDNPDVIAAVADLRLVYKVFVIANGNLTMSKGPFDKTIAGLRAHRACGAFRAACVKLRRQWSKQRWKIACTIDVLRYQNPRSRTTMAAPMSSTAFQAE